MNAKIVFYKQDKLDQNAKFKLRRALLGIRQKSNFSQYSYKIEGLLDKIDNYRPVNSSIVVEEKNLNLITDILIQFNAKYEVFDIEIPKSKLVK